MKELERLLFIDDDSIDTIALRRALMAVGYAGQISVARSVAEAEQVIRATLPQLVLLDLNLPGPSGHALLQAMRQGSPDGALSPPVVVVTSSADVEERDRCFAAGVVGYFVKPIDFQELVETMRSLLDYWRRSLRPAPS